MRFPFIAGTLLVITLAAQAEPLIGFRKQPDPHPYSPNDAVVMALADAQGLPDEIRHTTRYLALHNIPIADRFDVVQCLNFCLNSLSRRRSITFVVPVQGSNGAVMRVNLDEYGMNHDAWENLAIKGSGPVRISKKTDQPEEFFYSVVQSKTKTVKKQRQQTKNGKLLFYDVGTPNEKPAMEDYEETVVESAAPPWIDLAAMTSLQTSTKSGYPILRADWFIANATMTPAYNEIMGFKTLKDFQEFVRFRERDLDRATKGIVVDSQEVALHQRAILVTPTSLGRYHETYDYFDSRGERNLLKDLVKKRRDAGEVFAEGPNGLQFFALINGKDEIIDFADPAIATDQSTPWRNKLVYGGLTSCVTCHVDGAKAVADEVRALTAPPFGLLTRADEKKKAEEVKDLFFSGGIDDLITATKAVNLSRVSIATKGLTPTKNSAMLRKLFVGYWQGTLTLDDAAREVGSTAAEIRPLITALKSPSPDPTLTQLIANRPVRRDMFMDGGYQQLAAIVYQLKRTQP